MPDKVGFDSKPDQIGLGSSAPDFPSSSSYLWQCLPSHALGLLRPLRLCHHIEQRAAGGIFHGDTQVGTGEEGLQEELGKQE